MIEDFSTGSDRREVEADVCIIGSGAAGQYVAKPLLQAGKKVLILEGGKRDFDRQTQSLAEGDVSAEPYYALDKARLRMLGGTTAIWGGRCSALDDIDYKHRSWVPHSGWPIGREDIDPHMRAVLDEMGLYWPDQTRPWEALGMADPGLDPDKLSTQLWVFDESKDRFNKGARQELTEAQIILGANVTEIVADPDSGRITQVHARNFGGGELVAKAQFFVIAAGGIDTPRLMLASNTVQPKGLGNGHDLVGRFFMEHPHARGGDIEDGQILRILNLTPWSVRRKGQRLAPVIRLSEAAQERLGLLNSSLTFAVRRREGEQDAVARKVFNDLRVGLPSVQLLRGAWQYGKDLKVRYREMTDKYRLLMKVKLSRPSVVTTVIRAEQAPNPESRVTLSADRDALGMQRPNLALKFSNQDKESAKGLVDTVASELKRLGLGEMKPARWFDSDAGWYSDPLVSKHAFGGYHHIGTTRMADDPKSGVVDADCRVFDNPNLYIAGSSVFPTSGWANPTLAVMALSRRLGLHLSSKL